MYLRTPKKYSAKGRRTFLINWTWLWLYVLVPVVAFGGWLIIQNSTTIRDTGATAIARLGATLNPPSPTPTVPTTDLEAVLWKALEEGKVNSAISALSGLADNNPNDAQYYAQLARLIALRGDANDPAREKDAIIAAEKAINADPERADGWIAMALAKIKADQPTEALSFALHARDLDEKSPFLMAVLAEIYSALDQPDAANTLADQAIAESQAAGAATSLDRLGLVYAKWVKGVILLGTNGAAAPPLFEEAWRAAKTDALIPLGFIAIPLYGPYVTANRDDEIVQLLTEASDRDRDDSVIQLYLGLVYIRQRAWDRARPYIARCIDLDQKNVRCLRRMAQILYNQDNYVQAAQYGQQAVDNGSDEPEAFLLAGLSYIEGPGRNCSQGVPLLQRGYQIVDDRTSDPQRRADLKQQFIAGMNTCNARPLAAGNVTAPTSTPTAQP
jgi:tetratricopeptide (TPR) repeat protein